VGIISSQKGAERRLSVDEELVRLIPEPSRGFRRPALGAQQNAVPLACGIDAVNAQPRPAQPPLIVRQRRGHDLLIDLRHEQKPVRAIERPNRVHDFTNGRPGAA